MRFASIGIPAAFRSSRAEARKARTHWRSGGFTLIEALVALTLVLAFAAALTPHLFQSRRIASDAEARVAAHVLLRTLLDTPFDRGSIRGAALLQITTVAGATPTVTVNILGSVDGTNFFNIGYAVTATPETVAVAALVLTGAATTVQYYILRRDHPWRYLKLNYSANTNMQVTADLYLTADPYVS